MLDLNEKLYEELLAGEKPVLVEYWAPWCVYCRRITVAMEQVRIPIAELKEYVAKKCEF